MRPQILLLSSASGFIDKCDPRVRVPIVVGTGRWQRWGGGTCHASGLLDCTILGTFCLLPLPFTAPPT